MSHSSVVFATASVRPSRLLSLVRGACAALALMAVPWTATHAGLAVSGSAPLASFPAGVAVDSNSGRVYVVTDAESKVQVFDANLNPLGSIAVPPGFGAYRIALDTRPASPRLFVGFFSAGAVGVYNLNASGLSAAAVCTVGGLGGGVAGMSFNPNTNKLYVAVEGPQRVSVLNASNPTGCPSLVSHIAMGVKPNNVDVDPLANRIYVSIHHQQLVSVIDGNTDTRVSPDIPTLAADPTDVAVDPVAHKLFVAYSQGNRITEIATGSAGLGPYTAAPVHYVVGDGPRQLALDAGLGRTYAMILNFGQVRTVENGVVLPAVAVGGSQDDLNVNTTSHCLYVTSRSPHRVVKLCEADTTPPVIAATVSPAANGSGWNNSAVTVSWSLSDPESGIASSSGCGSSTVSSEGAGISLNCSASNGAGLTAAQSVSLSIDLTAPTVSYSGNAGSYTVDQQVSISCTAADALSGVASSSCSNISGPAYSFASSNSFSATATDLAGNTGSGSASFSVVINASGINALIGQCTAAPLAGQLQQKLGQIVSAPNSTAKQNMFDNFSKHVNKNLGGFNPASCANTLIYLAQQL